MKNAKSQDLVRYFKALSDESRIEILHMLSEKSMCVKALVARLNISQPAVSQHLRILREANLIRGEKKGYWVHYTVQPSTVAKVERALERAFSHPKSRRCAVKEERT